jgi:hypothetical protein
VAANLCSIFVDEEEGLVTLCAAPPVQQPLHVFRML